MGAKFNVGDLVVPNEGARAYTYTGVTMLLGEVVRTIDDSEIRIKILEHKKHPRHIGESYDVNPKFFDHHLSNENKDTLLNKLIAGQIDQRTYERYIEQT